uniref:Uncharacterized protein n=1 Tax=Salix viminalis TaxID=40686 RepID=A0A6N2MW30_SALVM
MKKKIEISGCLICSAAKTFAISGCLCKLLVAVQETWEGRSSHQIPMSGKSRDLETLNFERLAKENQLTGLLHRVEMASEILERDHVAFEDRGDANNFCYLPESFEDLGGFRAYIVPLQTKLSNPARFLRHQAYLYTFLEASLSLRQFSVIVVEKGRPELYGGQPFSAAEMALSLKKT